MPGYNPDIATALGSGAYPLQLTTAPTQGSVLAWHVGSAAFLDTSRASGVGTASTVGMLLANTTPAAAGAQQYSGRFALLGRGWSTDAGGASMVAGFGFDARPAQGAAVPSANLYITRNINGTWTDLFNFSSGGTFICPTVMPTDYLAIAATAGYGTGYLSLSKNEIAAGAVAAVLGNVPTNYTFGGWLQAWRASDNKSIGIPYWVAP